MKKCIETLGKSLQKRIDLKTEDEHIVFKNKRESVPQFHRSIRGP